MKKLTGSNIPFFFFLVLCSMTTYFLLTNGLSKTGFGLIIRSTGRTSVTFFLLAFGASGFQYFWKNSFTNWVRKNRRYLGISFAISHYFHLAGILYLNFIISEPIIAERGLIIVGLGGLGYVFLTLMALTSTDKAIETIGIKNWKILHWVGSHYLWIVFSTSYIPRAVSDYFYIPFAAGLIFVIIIRLSYFLKIRSSK